MLKPLWIVHVIQKDQGILVIKKVKSSYCMSTFLINLKSGKKRKKKFLQKYSEKRSKPLENNSNV